MTVLIVGMPTDVPSKLIYDKITARGGQAAYFDTMAFPADVRLTFDPETPAAGGIRLTPNGPLIKLANIQSVYRRWSNGIQSPDEEDATLREVVYWNLESAVGSFMRDLDCLWVNSEQATQRHKYKGYQLKLLKAAGLRIPETVMTNDPETVVAFYERLKRDGRKAIYKPVRGWAHTTVLEAADLEPSRLETLANSPVALQEMIEGVDIRAYWLDGQLFPMEIQASTVDFREDYEARRVPIVLPDAVAEDCGKLAKTLGYVFTGIDLRRTPSGEYYFFEGNPTPMFVHDEQTSGHPISDRLVDVLLGA